MKLLRIYIVEDEPLIASTIETALLKQGYQVCGDTDNAHGALSDIKSLRPDLVLVDIQLDGDKTGVYLAKQLDSLGVPYIYLTSQTDPQTITEVKQTKPLGYIVKPFTEAGLRSSIEIAWNNYSQEEDDFLVFTSNNMTYKIKQSQILYLKAFDNYCYIFTQDTKYLVPKTLKYTSETLTDQFIKTHRSYIVNSSKITSISSDFVLLDVIEVPLSQSYKETIRQYFKN
ncbi:MAG TPA: response regulator transcription factor [Mangrovimonas sp.]|nr:response regulator transcription factor [Mangrovimonas sp.]